MHQDKKTKSIQFYGLYLLLYCLSLAVVKGLAPVEVWQSYLVSTTLVTLNLVSLGLSLCLFFLKKNIALLTGLIVLKWSILVYLSYYLLKAIELNSLGFSLGIIPLMISGFVWAMMQKA